MAVLKQGKTSETETEQQTTTLVVALRCVALCCRSHLLDCVLLGSREAGDVVHVGDAFEGRLGGGDLAGDGGVHAGDLGVHAHVGVVQVHLLLPAEVLDAIVVDLRTGVETSEEQGCSEKADRGCLGELLRQCARGEEKWCIRDQWAGRKAGRRYVGIQDV